MQASSQSDIHGSLQLTPVHETARLAVGQLGHLSNEDIAKDDFVSIVH